MSAATSVLCTCSVVCQCVGFCCWVNMSCGKYDQADKCCILKFNPSWRGVQYSLTRNRRAALREVKARKEEGQKHQQMADMKNNIDTIKQLLGSLSKK